MPPKRSKYVPVGINYHVELCEDRHYYSVPHYLRKRGEKTKVKVIYNDRTAAIYYENVWIDQHKRDRPPNGYSTLPEHMPLHHRYVAELSPERFMRLAKAVGEDVNLVVEKMLGSRKHPEQAFKVCMGLLNLSKEYGAERVNRAFRSTMETGVKNKFTPVELVDHLVDAEWDDRSHVPITEWHEIIGDPTIADALCDRFVHTTHRIQLEGESVRKIYSHRAGDTERKSE